MQTRADPTPGGAGTSQAAAGTVAGAAGASTFHTVADVLAGRHTGQRVRLRGWVHRQRTGGKIAFVWLRDGTGVVQCTVKGGVADDASLAEAARSRIESSVELEGDVVADARAPGGHEVRVARFQVRHLADDFPLRGEQGTDFELDNRHLWLRSTELSAVLRIKHRLYKAIRDFFDAEGFFEVDPSVITTNACEGGSTLFTFDYFGQTAYLSQSAQMYLEGCIFGIPKVYSVTPSFRAEKSRTAKHLTEFHHLEAEAAWWELEDNLRFQERMVTFLARRVAADSEADLRILGQDPERLRRIGTFVAGESAADEPGQRFARMTYDEAAQRLRDLGFHFPHGEDFGVPHEKALTEGRTNPVFITHWPAKIKAFYMAEDPDRPGYAKCADLLAPDGFGEIIGGSQRSESVAWMEQRLKEQFFHEFEEHLAERALHEDRTAAYLLGTSVHDESAAVQHLREMCEFGRVDAKPVLAALPEDPLSSGDEPNAALGVFWNEYLKPYQWYFDLRKYGSVPHSGFGLGIERLLRWFTGQEHIRDMLPYPRTPARAYP